MKYSQARAFEKHLADAAPDHFAHVYMLLGKDEAARKEASEHLVKMLLKDVKQPALCLHSFTAQQSQPEEVVEELNTMGFFAEKKVLLVHGVEKWVKAKHAVLDPFLAKPLPGVYLVLDSTSLAANTTLFKKIEKVGIVLDLPEEKAWEKEKTLQTWGFSYIQEQGKKITQDALLALAKGCDGDQIRLKQELEKLICFIDQRIEISLQDVEKLCVQTPSETIWQLGEAIFRRDAPQALCISKNLLDAGTAFLGLLRQIRTQCETGFHISSILATGGTGHEVTQQFPYMKGAILERNLNTARKFGKNSYKKALVLLDSTELQAKNSQINEELLNELLILKLVKT